MSKKEQPNYYAIIPATVRYDTNLKYTEKLLYGEITALSNKNGYCYAQNKYFADLYNVTAVSVSRWISHLQQLGYIKTEVIRKIAPIRPNITVASPIKRQHHRSTLLS